MKRLPLIAASMLLLAATRAQALDILICNDDGFTSANSRALYQKLIADGHRVVLAAPVDNQSGRGGYVSFLAPIPPIAASYVDPYTGRTAIPRAVRATYPALVGTAGVGSDPSDLNIAYVNGSPVMACLYGVDVKAPQVFGGVPDLVISGPNEGNNLGMINASSGTVNNAYYMINRDIPAIAVSDAVSTSVEFTALTPTSRAYEVAGIVSRLVDTLVKRRDTHGHGHEARAGRAHEPGRLLPHGVGLNVNIPSFTPGSGSTLRFALTHMGTATATAPAFYEDLGQNAFGKAVGIPSGAGLSGIGLVASGETLPTGVTVPADNSPTSEANVIARGGAVAVSPIAGLPEAADEVIADLMRRFRVVEH